MIAKFVVSLTALVAGLAGPAAESRGLFFSGEKRLNNLAAELLELSSISNSGNTFTFNRSNDGWIFITASCRGNGKVMVILDSEVRPDAIPLHDPTPRGPDEAMRYVTKGKHTIQVDCEGDILVEKLIVRAIPELVHCGLGYDPQIKSYGHYDMDFLKAEILPNITTLIVPSNMKLAEPV